MKLVGDVTVGVKNFGAEANDAAAELTGELETGLANNSSAKGWGNFLELICRCCNAMGLTGVSSTVSVGTLGSPADVHGSLTGVSATTSVGSPDVDDTIVGLSGQSATSSVGSIAPADVIGISGLELEINLGSSSTTSNPIILPTGFGLTSNVGSIDPADQFMGLTGVSATFNIGSPTVIGSLDLTLTGQSATSNVAGFGTASGFGIQAYQSVDTGSNTSYTDVA